MTINTTRQQLRDLVDHVWNVAYEDESVPSTDWADQMIDHIFSNLLKQQDNEMPPKNSDIVALAAKLYQTVFPTKNFYKLYSNSELYKGFLYTAEQMLTGKF